MRTLSTELSGVERVPNLKSRGKVFGASAWVAIVLVAAAGGFAVFEIWQRAKTARASAERYGAELELARDRARAADDRAAAAEKATADLKAAHVAELDKLAAQNAVLTAEREKVAAKSDALAMELEKTVGKNEGELAREDGKLTLNLLDKVLFKTGEADLTPTGKKVLKRVGDAMNKHPDRAIWVIGHTDNLPIKTPEFPSNWELSTARALSVVHFLVEEVKVDPRRLAAAGMGPYRPASKTNRAKNRRIEIVLFPKDVRYVKP
jgi:chemotaxis protein MotB